MRWLMYVLRKLWRIARWVPILWKDEDWDFAFLLRIMCFKIALMQDHMMRHSIVAHAEDEALSMHQAQVMIRNIVDEDPDDEFSAHYAQYHVGNVGLSDCPEKDKCYEASVASMNRSIRNWDSLWDHMKKHAQGWWD